MLTTTGGTPLRHTPCIDIREKETGHHEQDEDAVTNREGRNALHVTYTVEVAMRISKEIRPPSHK